MGSTVTINSSKAKEKIAKLQKLRYKKLRVGFFEKGNIQILMVSIFRKTSNDTWEGDARY